jgi:hypothetical protein
LELHDGNPELGMTDSNQSCWSGMVISKYQKVPGITTPIDASLFHKIKPTLQKTFTPMESVLI